MGWMTNLSPLIFAAFVVGCGSGDGGKDGDTDSDAVVVEIPEFTFNTAVNAGSIEGEVGADALDHHRVLNTVMSAIQVVLAEDQVVARLQVDNGSRRMDKCWNAPPVAQTNFVIDYNGCEDDGMTGGVYVDDTPQGPVVFEFLNFTFDDSRTLTGAVALDSSTADGNLEWALYDTVANAPSPNTPSPVGVAIDGTAFSFGIVGGADLDLQFNTIAQWGVVSVGTLGGQGTVLAGGTDAADLQSSNKPSASMSGAWASCRCPYIGTQVYDFDLVISEVTIDLDKLDTEDDDFDDPDMSFLKDVTVEGSAEVSTVACGEYEVVFTPASEPTVVVTGPEIRAEIGRLCDIALIEETKCLGFLNAAEDVGELIVTIGNAKMQAAAEDTVRTQFDGGFCRY